MAAITAKRVIIGIIAGLMSQLLFSSLEALRLYAIADLTAIAALTYWPPLNTSAIAVTLSTCTFFPWSGHEFNADISAASTSIVDNTPFHLSFQPIFC